MKSIEYHLPPREKFPQSWLQRELGEDGEEGSLLLLISELRDGGVAAKPKGAPFTLVAGVAKLVTVGQVFMVTET